VAAEQMLPVVGGAEVWGLTTARQVEKERLLIYY
jgi:hypothetical protein